MLFKKTISAISAFTFMFLSVTGTAYAFTPDPELLKKAKKEGEVVWYTTLIADQLSRPMAKAFEEKFPSINVKFIRMPAGQIALKLRQQIRAGSVKVDVFDANAAFSKQYH